MSVYADTSALLPYYRLEARSEAIEALLLAQIEPVVISELTRVEFASALARWVRMGELIESQANRLESAFHEDVVEGRFQVRAVGRRVFERAQHWLLSRRTSLRTLDALHLASAEAASVPLLTLDDALLRAAEFLGVGTRRVD